MLMIKHIFYGEIEKKNLYFWLKKKQQHKKKHSYVICYGKCPKISYTKVSDKISHTNSVDPDETTPE